MGTSDDRTQGNWQEVTGNVLHWVGIDRHNAGRGRPLMMYLVDMLIQPRVVKQPEKKYIA